MAQRKAPLNVRLTAQILRITTDNAVPASTIAHTIGANWKMTGYIIDLIVRLANDGKLVRSWDTDGMCYYTAA